MESKNRLTPGQHEHILVDDVANSDWSLFQQRITSQVDEVIASGEWSNLPGKGTPLQLLSLTPEEQAYKLLKDAGFVPDWIELRKKIEAIDDELREKGPLAVSDEDVAVLQRRCDELNEIIRKHNRLVPSPVLQRGLKGVREYLAH